MTGQHRTPAIAIAAAALLAGAPAFAGGFTVGLSQATMINEHVPGNNIGGASCPLVAGRSNDNASRFRTALQYNLPTNLANRVGSINSFSLGISTSTTLFNGNVGAAAAASYNLYHVGGSWSQGVQACTQAAGGFMAGAACTGTGATWNGALCTSGAYSLSGGTTNNAGSGTAPTWSGCPGSVCTDVLGWLNTPSTNHGWMVVSSNDLGGVAGASRLFPGSLSVTWSCKAGTTESPANFCTTCTSSANSACVTSASGNTCNDPGPPSLSYTCTCNNAAYTGTGGTSCVDKNECSPNPCNTNGDTAATCTDAVAPASGHTCNCSAGFLPSGGTCLGACGSGPDPCGGGSVGTCSTMGLPAGTWTCTCGSGYVTTGGTHPFCTDFNACDANALVDCVTTCPSTAGTCTAGNASGNNCVDEAPPSTTYHCSCGNPAYVVGTVGGGRSACVNKNECAPNNCTANGDVGALCTDHPAPATGFDCACSSATAWTLTSQGPGPTCVDTDECVFPNPTPGPCLEGKCTNILLGGGYSCECNPGFVEINGTTPSPACVHPSACTPVANMACATSQAANRCLDDPPPAIGYTCDCGDPGYTVSPDAQRCVDKNGCDGNHCGEGGDNKASCVDNRAPNAGYTCDCSAGFAFNGVTCADLDECHGTNPCVHGTCSNTKGSYACSCSSGFKLAVVSGAPTCAPNGATHITFSVIPGSCGVGGAPAPLSPLWLLAFALAVTWRRRLASRR